MPTYKADQTSRSLHASSESGNAWSDSTKTTVTANLTTADEVILGVIPAGTRLDRFEYRNGDLDSGTTLTMNVGYRSAHPDARTQASATYFLSASTAFRAEQATWVDLAFEPVTFNEPVFIVGVPGANGTGLAASASIWSRFGGQVVGIK